jgi:aromatic ring hydroxylase
MIPKHKDVLTCPTDGGNGSFTHKFFRVARSREDLIAQREAIAAWARMSYGWMGRTPDYKASLMNTLGVQYDFYGKFADNAKAWYRRAQDNVLFMNHAIVNPPVDRNKAPSRCATCSSRSRRKPTRAATCRARRWSRPRRRSRTTTSSARTPRCR